MLWEALTAELASHRTHDSTPHTPENSAAGYADATIIRLARSLQHPVTLVIDDYHHLSDQVNDLAIAELSAAAPQLSIVVIARRLSLLDGRLISARTRVRVIGPADLALSQSESLELAAALGTPHSEQLNFALKQCEGWPLAVAATLQLGSDHLYLNTPHGRTWNPAEDPRAFDPIANLTEFAHDHLNLLEPPAREVILAASQLDAISLTQAARLLGTTPETALTITHQVIDRGLLIETHRSDSTSYRIHPAVKAPLNTHATQTIDFATRKTLYRDRATDIELTAPFTAFRLFCAAEDYDAAERLLAHNFSLITDETEICTPLLRSLPEDVLVAHPTLIGALLFLELPQPHTAPSTIHYLVGLWHHALKLRLPQGSATAPGPIHLPLLFQTMVLTRLLGRLDDAHSLMLHLESRLTPARLTGQDEKLGDIPLRTAMTFAGSLPTYLREAATTALMVGDFDRARRNLQQLQQLAERKIAKPWAGFSFDSTRTVTDTQSGSRWVLTALSELAFTEALDGNMNECARVLAEMDAWHAAHQVSAPGISWIGAEIARAHLSYELEDEFQLYHAVTKLTPYLDRIEAWPLLLIAEAASLRNTHGNGKALAHIDASLENLAGILPANGAWTEFLLCYQALLRTTSGDLAKADHLLAQCSENSVQVRLERARLSLYAGEDVEALLQAQQIGTPGTTARQRLTQSLIAAVAAWNCKRQNEAFLALDTATDLLHKHGLRSVLRSVPHDMLLELALAAQAAGVCDLVATVEAIPELLRSRRYERLTEMELRTLSAIAEHRSANQAAAALFITAGTVKKHLASVYRKLRVNGRDEALLQASRMGLLLESE